MANLKTVKIQEEFHKTAKMDALYRGMGLADYIEKLIEEAHFLKGKK
jgi:predicted HicB family RNase H-like nuclease